MTYAFGQVAHKIDENNAQLVDGCGSSFLCPIDGRLGYDRAYEVAREVLDSKWNKDRGLVAIKVYTGSFCGDHSRGRHWFTIQLKDNQNPQITYHS